MATTVAARELEALGRRFVDEVFNAHDPDALDRFTHEDFKDHTLPPGLENNREGTRAYFQRLFTAFPDIRMQILDQWVDGDVLIQHFRASGTQLGEWMGAQPAGQPMHVEGVDILHVRDGLFVEHRGVVDTTSMMRDQGDVPQTSQRPSR